MGFRRLLAVIMGLSLLATACGDSSGGEADSDGARFVYANPFPISDLDPSTAFSSENIVLQNVYETLTTYNPPGSPDLVSGSLAESWEANDDATVWTFNL